MIYEREIVEKINNLNYFSKEKTENYTLAGALWCI